MTDALIVLSRRDVLDLLTLPECIGAVEQAFRLHAEGRTLGPGVLGVPAADGGFHIKAAGLVGPERSYFAAKTNANFPQNPRRFGLPTIQGTIVLADASNGVPLAMIGSGSVTALRTGAATAVAAKFLARRDRERPRSSDAASRVRCSWPRSPPSCRWSGRGSRHGLRRARRAWPRAPRRVSASAWRPRRTCAPRCVGATCALRVPRRAVALSSRERRRARHVHRSRRRGQPGQAGARARARRVGRRSSSTSSISARRSASCSMFSPPA